ncbi:MAG: DUF2339 domain-containing protein [Bacteroidota bacterium]
MMGDMVLILLALGGFIAAMVALSQGNRLDSDLRAVRKRLAEVETQLRRLMDGKVVPPAPVPAPPVAAPSTSTPSTSTPPTPAPAIEQPAIAAKPPAPPPPPLPLSPMDEVYAEAPPPAAAKAPPASAVPASVAKAPPIAVERVLTERWLVWLGGLALALGGAFLVKVTIEQGLLMPEVRVALGALGGACLMAGGHWLKRRSVAGRDMPDQVPSALVGAGGSMLFVSIYAAYALYHLIGQVPAFGLLAVVAGIVAVMSLSHGPYVALLGLVGAYVVPLLVRSDVPNAVGLFTYLLVVSAGLLTLLRWRAWLWLAWVVLGASAGWTLLWLVGPWQQGDEGVLGAYLVSLFGLFVAFRLGIPMVAALTGRIEAPQARRVVAVAALVIAALVVPVALMAHFSPAALALPLVLAAAMVAFGWHDAAFDRLPWLAAVALLAVLAAWDWPVARSFAVTAGLGAALLGGVGFAIALRAPRPWTWAAGAAAVPAALLAVAYWRLSAVFPDWGWSVAALLLAALQVAAAERFNRFRSQDGNEAALAAAATGVIAAVALAATFALAEAWLTVALAVLVAGIAWVEGQLRVAGLRKVALAVAGVVVVRLVANPAIFGYMLPPSGLVNWLVYGYGLPAMAFWFAARLFRRGGEDLLVGVLEVGAVTFATLLVSLEIHLHQSGALDFSQPVSLNEFSLHTIAWNAGAAMLFLVHRRGGSKVLLGAGWALWGLATAQAVLVQGLVDNPLVTGEPVGDGLLFNLLLLIYAAPAALYALQVPVAPERPTWARTACGGLALVFAFAWASLEVRHAFVGSQLGLGPVGDAEMWVYSVVWLMGGVAMMGGGILRRSALLRRAGLGVVLLVVAKVFILDMAQLRGLWRALSFLALGGVLVGIGGLYRRFAKYI